jgi:hypothetical protein
MVVTGILNTPALELDKLEILETLLAGDPGAK